MTKFPVHDYVRLAMKRYQGIDADALETFLEVVSVVKTMNCGMEAYFQKIGFSHARFKVMVNILFCANPDGASPASLAETSGVKRATITGLLDTLENDQWIERHPDPNDRRGLLIRLTEAGREKLDSVLPAHYARIARAMAHLSKDEHVQLRALIRKFGYGLDLMESHSIDHDDTKKDKEDQE